MRRVLIALTLATAVVTASAHAQMTLPDKAPGQPDPKVVKAGTYNLDSGHSQVVFTVNHLGYTEYTGLFTNPSGTLVFDPSRPPASKVTVSFPIAGVKTTVAELDVTLNGHDFFDAAEFPSATFVSTEVVTTSPTTFTITGNLTIRGITKPVVLKARFIGAGPEFWGEKKMAVGFAATTTIKRSDFGMGTGLALISDKIDLKINAGFEAQ